MVQAIGRTSLYSLGCGGPSNVQRASRGSAEKFRHPLVICFYGNSGTCPIVVKVPSVGPRVFIDGV